MPPDGEEGRMDEDVVGLREALPMLRRDLKIRDLRDELGVPAELGEVSEFVLMVRRVLRGRHASRKASLENTLDLAHTRDSCSPGLDRWNHRDKQRKTWRAMCA